MSKALSPALVSRLRTVLANDRLSVRRWALPISPSADLPGFFDHQYHPLASREADKRANQLLKLHRSRPPHLRREPSEVISALSHAGRNEDVVEVATEGLESGRVPAARSISRLIVALCESGAGKLALDLVTWLEPSEDEIEVEALTLLIIAADEHQESSLAALLLRLFDTAVHSSDPLFEDSRIAEAGQRRVIKSHDRLLPAVFSLCDAVPDDEAIKVEAFASLSRLLARIARVHSASALLRDAGTRLAYTAFRVLKDKSPARKAAVHSIAGLTAPVDRNAPPVDSALEAPYILDLATAAVGDGQVETGLRLFGSAMMKMSELHGHQLDVFFDAMPQPIKLADIEAISSRINSSSCRLDVEAFASLYDRAVQAGVGDESWVKVTIKHCLSGRVIPPSVNGTWLQALIGVISSLLRREHPKATRGLLAEIALQCASGPRLTVRELCIVFEGVLESSAIQLETVQDICKLLRHYSVEPTFGIVTQVRKHVGTADNPAVDWVSSFVPPPPHKLRKTELKKSVLSAFDM